MQKSIEIPEFNIHLDARRAVIHSCSSTMIVSDLHIGKQAHLRKNGLALPQYDPTLEIQKLEAIASEYSISRIVYAGDLFHSTHNSETNHFLNWIQESSFEHVLVKGNHDIITSLPERLEVQQTLLIDQIEVCHQGKDAEFADQHTLIIEGHIHPGITIGKRHLKQRLACFHLSNQILTIPAFGSTTGLFNISPKSKDRVWGVIDQEEVILELKT